MHGHLNVKNITASVLIVSKVFLDNYIVTTSHCVGSTYPGSSVPLKTDSHPNCISCFSLYLAESRDFVHSKGQFVKIL